MACQKIPTITLHYLKIQNHWQDFANLLEYLSTQKRWAEEAAWRYGREVPDWCEGIHSEGGASPVSRQEERPARIAAVICMMKGLRPSRGNLGGTAEDTAFFRPKGA